jgi:hypothetical protein
LLPPKLIRERGIDFAMAGSVAGIP